MTCRPGEDPLQPSGMICTLMARAHVQAHLISANLAHPSSEAGVCRLYVETCCWALEGIYSEINGMSNRIPAKNNRIPAVFKKTVDGLVILEYVRDC
jgi:hypothetical protein